MSADQPDDYKDTFVLYRHITGHCLVKVKDRLRLSEVSVWKLVNTITPKVNLGWISWHRFRWVQERYWSLAALASNVILPMLYYHSQINHLACWLSLSFLPANKGAYTRKILAAILFYNRFYWFPVHNSIGMKILLWQWYTCSYGRPQHWTALNRFKRITELTYHRLAYYCNSLTDLIWGLYLREDLQSIVTT